MSRVRDSSGGLPAAWGGVRGDLLDVNVWLALAQPAHPHHAMAVSYWQETLAAFAAYAFQTPQAVPSKLYFCRVTMLGFVRILCQTATHAGQSMSLRDAHAAYARFAQMPSIGFLPDSGLSIDAQMEALLTAQPQLSARLSTDVYLAALAKHHGLRLVSFDRDFERLGLDDCLILRC